MYCLLRNRCKYIYKCCSDCKQKCDERCTDNQNSCKFCVTIEPTIVQRFTVDNKEIINIKKPTKIEKVDKNIAKTTKITKVDIKINETKHSKNNLFNKPKFKKKKSLI